MDNLTLNLLILQYFFIISFVKKKSHPRSVTNEEELSCLLDTHTYCCLLRRVKDDFVSPLSVSNSVVLLTLLP